MKRVEQEGEPKKVQEEKKRSSETEDHQKQRLATLKRLKRGNEDELERKLRLEKVVASKHLRLAVKTEEKRRARLENDAMYISIDICVFGGVLVVCEKCYNFE